MNMRKLLPPIEAIGTVRPGRKVRTVPDQSLTVRDILYKFAKGLPVAQRVQESIFLDQDKYDMEALSRMSFDEKMEFADKLKAEAQQIKEAFEAKKVNDELAKRERERLEEAKRFAEYRKAGIENLDNTMPDDTKLKTK